MTAMQLLGGWITIAIVLTVAIARAGYLRKQVRKVDHVCPFGQQPRGDLSELGGFSQSNHFGGMPQIEVHNHG